MVKEVYISYQCIIRECGGYKMYPQLLTPWQGPDKHIHTFIHIYKNIKNIKL